MDATLPEAEKRLLDSDKERQEHYTIVDFNAQRFGNSRRECGSDALSLRGKDSDTKSGDLADKF
ncbi:para-aminobenzoate synthase component I [Pasteurella multocida subsp. multocida str. Anand1_cattle]|nr:para-aminobenzoate synthase component I [Pasteurella multocida subsp. multocida str. Anand1_cattle]